MVHTKVRTALQGREYLVMHLPNELHLSDAQIQSDCVTFTLLFSMKTYMDIACLSQLEHKREKVSKFS
jgi:hypothetical protein